jgi:hypothetical protein
MEAGRGARAEVGGKIAEVKNGTGSRFQGFKVSRFQSFRVSRFHKSHFGPCGDSNFETLKFIFLSAM